MATRTYALPFPRSNTIYVYEDRPEMEGLRPWQYPTDAHVATYTLPVDDYDCVDLDGDEWELFANQLTSQHPCCVFAYIEE